MKRIFILAVSIFLSQLLPAQKTILSQTIKGTITDEQSGNILSNVTVIVIGLDNRFAANTDSLGQFRITDVPLGRQHIRAGMIGYEEVVVRNIEVTSAKEVVIDIKLKEKIIKQEAATVTGSRSKSRALNDAAIVSARQLSMDEANRYSGTRNDPSRMAQNFAGVSGSNDARNDIVIRGNSPTGILWRMDGVDIPNPNHYSTLGATGGPVSILNSNTLKNSDFMTGAFPAQYGNALAGVFDLRMRNGNTDKYEFLGQAGFNGFEFAAEGPLSKKNKSSFLIDYRYSLVALIQAAGLSVGTGNATPYYQDIHYKVNIPTKKSGTFSLFGLGGESHITFPYNDKDNLYVTSDGSLRDRTSKSLTGITGVTHTYFFNPQTSGKLTFAVSGTSSKYFEDIIRNAKPEKRAFNINNTQVKYTGQYIFNKKINARSQLTAGATYDYNRLNLLQQNIKNGDSTISTIYETERNTALLRGFVNGGHRFSEKLSSNAGVYYQYFSLNKTWSIEPRWNIKYQVKPGHALSFGAGLHSQIQPLQVYFYQSTAASGQKELTNKNLDFTKSTHAVLGYDFNFSRNLRFKTEVYGQYIFDAPVEQTASSFSLLNYGADFGFPDKTNLVNKGKGYNYGIEMTLERFLNKGYYYLLTASLFDSRYKGSDDTWRNSGFNNSYVVNALGGKEFALNSSNSIGIDTKFALAGGQRYTPFNKEASKLAGYTIYRETEAFSLRNDMYWRWDLKFSYTRNGKKTTQKWYIDLQNLTNTSNLYIRTLTPSTGKISEINQIGFFPNINYQITF
jgi:hypothetical protein